MGSLTCVCVVRACRSLECLFAQQRLDKDIFRLAGSRAKARDLTRGDPSVMIGLNESRRLSVNPHLVQGLAFLGHVEIGDSSLERLSRHAYRL
jgi:hypothetical protein